MLGQAEGVFTPKKETELMFDESKRLAIKEKLIQEASEQGCNRVVEKTPSHIKYVEEIRELFPSAKFVMPVRDGRDVAASIMVRTGNINYGIDRWILDNQKVANFMNDEDVLVYRHEDLVSDQEQVLKKICDFLEITFSKKLLNFHEKKEIWTGVQGNEKGSGIDGIEHNKLRSWQISQPVFNNSGRWKKDLDEKSKAILNDKLLSGSGKELMKLFRYL